MKLNLNAGEVLALYNLLHERHFRLERDVAGDDVHLQQVHGRLQTAIVSALGGNAKVIDPVGAWLKREQAKIDDLADQNEELKDVVGDLGSILTDDDDEVDVSLGDYPRRKHPPAPTMPKAGRQRRR